MNNHQLEQMKVIDSIEKQIQRGSLNFSTVSMVPDFKKDPRVCLTGIHFPKDSLKEYVYRIIHQLQNTFPEHYYYPEQSLHMTVKNIRVIHNPPNFSSSDIEKAKKVFSSVIPTHNTFQVYFYRLLLFPENLSLVGTTEDKLDNLIFDLDKKLQDVHISDDKLYSNSKYFFSNMTLVRFVEPVSQEFKQTISVLSDTLRFDPYVVDSVSLVSTNAVFYNPKIFGTWKLK